MQGVENQYFVQNVSPVCFANPYAMEVFERCCEERHERRSICLIHIVGVHRRSATESTFLKIKENLTIFLSAAWGKTKIFAQF